MAVTVQAYDTAEAHVYDGELDWLGSDIKVSLHTGLVFDAANENWSDVLATEIAAGNGYTAGGETVASRTVDQSGRITTIDGADVVWNASGGQITAAQAVVREATTVNERILHYIDFDGSKIADDGTPLTIRWNALGIKTVTLP